MLQDFSWTVDSRLAGQEIPDLVWNPRINYHIHKNPSLAPNLSHLNPVHTFNIYSEWHLRFSLWYLDYDRLECDAV
jgi:hypothetical protein